MDEDQRVADLLTHAGEGVADGLLRAHVASDDTVAVAQVDTQHRVARAAQALHHGCADGAGPADHDGWAGRLGTQCGSLGVSGSASHSVHDPSYTATSPKPANR